MPWTFQQSTGQVTGPDGTRRGCSYAGHGKGKNNPAMQNIHAGCRWDADRKLWIPVDGLTSDDWGPLPCGFYAINAPVDTTTHGPYVLWLTPDPENQMFGRSGFGWHGDSIEHPGLASEGCICSARPLRTEVWTGSDDHRLQVVS